MFIDYLSFNGASASLDNYTDIIIFAITRRFITSSFQISVNSSDQRYYAFVNTVSNEITFSTGPIGYSSKEYGITKLSFLGEDTNMVIKLDKVSSDPFSTYINGGLITTSSLLFSNGGTKVTSKSGGAAEVIVYAFRKEERGLAEACAEALRNPGTSYSETQAKIMVAERQALADREKAVKNRETTVEAKEQALEQREKDLGDAADGKGGGGTDGDKDKLSANPNFNPPDADEMKLSATVAWPRAIVKVLGSTGFANIQQRYNTLMSEWVAARGDNISSNSYDYFVYSHGVAWPKAALLESTTKANLTKIQEKHAEILKLLL